MERTMRVVLALLLLCVILPPHRLFAGSRSGGSFGSRAGFSAARASSPAPTFRGPAAPPSPSARSNWSTPAPTRTRTVVIEHEHFVTPSTHFIIWDENGYTPTPPYSQGGCLDDDRPRVRDAGSDRPVNFELGKR